MALVTPAQLRFVPGDGSTTFAPHGNQAPALADHDYVREEWIATGEVDGRPYATALCVRRPRDPARFSGTVIAEPLHVHGIAPIWMYTAPYILRSGHAWVEIAAQKTTLDMHVKPTNPQRYSSLHIDGPDTATFDPNPNLGIPERAAVFWSELDRRNHLAVPILAQVGAALRTWRGPFEHWPVGHVLLAGHSQTGNVVSRYIRDAHHARRLVGDSPVFDGYFPSGFPLDDFHDIGTPIVQVLSEGDIATPDYAFRPGYEGRRYRREDSDETGDLYRLYELAGVPHMGTRHAPYNNPAIWTSTFPDDGVNAPVTIGPRMNSLPHFELFAMGLHHLVEWVADGTTPPRADRIALTPDGYVAKDEHGNTRGGVRCAQLDVPHAVYRPNPVKADGTPSYITVGNEEPFDERTLRRLYRDSADYVERFNHRLDELIDQGWLLADDAGDMRQEAKEIDIPQS